jgi:hypothetical protein
MVGLVNPTATIAGSSKKTHHTKHSPSSSKKSLDFAVSNFARGQLLLFGESPGTMRLDGGAVNDHRALFGFLEFLP